MCKSNSVYRCLRCMEKVSPRRCPSVDVAPPPFCIELHQQWYLYVPVSRSPHTSLRSPNIYRQVIMISYRFQSNCIIAVSLMSYDGIDLSLIQLFNNCYCYFGGILLSHPGN